MTAHPVIDRLEESPNFFCRETPRHIISAHGMLSQKNCGYVFLTVVKFFLSRKLSEHSLRNAVADSNYKVKCCRFTSS